MRRNGADLEALLIGRGMPRVWSLPKGHVEARETHEQAALREVREETGCWAEILIKLSDISYWFYLNRTKHKKSVHFYLMRYLSGDTANHDHEVDEARWFEIKAAKKALKYVNEKRLVDLGLEWIEREDRSGMFEPEPIARPSNADEGLERDLERRPAGRRADACASRSMSSTVRWTCC